MTANTTLDSRVTVTGEQTNSGSYTATAKELSNANYALPEKATQAFTIGKKTVGLEWKNTAFTYDGKAHMPTATATGLVGEDTCAVTVTGEQTNAGNHTAKAATLSNANYALPEKATQAFTINPKTVGLEWKNTSFTYDGKAHMPTATATGLVEGDACTVTVTGEQTDAGSHTAKAAGLSNADYALPEANTQAFTIEARPVIVKARSASKVYGKKDPALTAKVSGLADGESAELIRYALTREAGEDVGEYAITAGGDAVQGNYIVTYQGAALTIREKTVRSPKVKVRVTGLTYDGRAKRPAVTVTAGKTVIPAGEYKVAYSDNVLPGEATVTISDVPGGNYAVGEASTTFPIAESVFMLSAKAEGENALVYAWDKVSGAQGYDLYFSRCGSKDAKQEMKLYKTVKE